MFQRPKKITIYNPIQICVIAAVEKNEEKKKMKKKLSCLRNIYFLMGGWGDMIDLHYVYILNISWPFLSRLFATITLCVIY